MIECLPGSVIVSPQIRHGNVFALAYLLRSCLSLLFGLLLDSHVELSLLLGLNGQYMGVLVRGLGGEAQERPSSCVGHSSRALIDLHQKL